jgi:hypothetical protein
MSRTSDASDRTRFQQDLEWLPEEDLFDRFPDDPDLGLLLTDGEYDVLLFEEIGPAAEEAFADHLVGSARGTSAPGHATSELLGARRPDLDALDRESPLLFLSRRGEARFFAAFQQWSWLPSLIEEDRRRRRSGLEPSPTLPPVDRTGVRRRLAALRFVLLLLVAVTLVPLVLSLLDTRGPVGYSLYDVTTSVNPLAPGSTLTVRTGDTVSTALLLPQTEAGVQQIDGIDWRLDEPLVLTYTPEPASDETFAVTFDLRDEGANLLARGRFVRADLVISDEAARLVISQPTVRDLTIERRILHEVTLERTRPATPLREATVLPCWREESRRWRAIPLEADLHQQFREVFASVTGLGENAPNDLIRAWNRAQSQSWQDRHHPAIAAGIEQNGQRLSGALGARFFTSRPPGSELVARLEAIQRDNAALAEAFRGRTGWSDIVVSPKRETVEPDGTRSTTWSVTASILQLDSALGRSTHLLRSDWTRLVEQDARAICAARGE